MDQIIEDFRGLAGLGFMGQSAFDRIDYERDDTGLPREKVIKCLYPDGSWFAVRPSGTEPKLKIYVAVRGDSEEAVAIKTEALQGALKGFVEKRQ
jgi:phosphomannomutase